MKKLVLFLACSSMAAASAFAQEDAQTLFSQGKDKFGEFDKAQTAVLMKQPIDTLAMGNSLIDGYNLMMKALPLDSVAEKEKDGTPKIDKKTGKAKIKTKYSKDIINLIAGHHNDFMIVGQFFNDTKNYKKAAECWGLYASLPDADFIKSASQKIALPDSTAAQFHYYEGVMYYQAKDNEMALRSFIKAQAKGSKTKELKEMTRYVTSLVISEALEAKQYDKCDQLINDAIASNPEEALYVMFQGIVQETKTDNIENAIVYYEKAAAMDPTLAMAQYHVGRYYNNKAVNLMNADANKNLTNAELAKMINPLCEKAKPYLERACELDTTNSIPDAKRLLQWVEDRLASK